MATVLETFDWSQVSRNSASPRTRTYPWDQWLDGRIWELEPETDFDGPAVSLEKVIRTTANRRGRKVRIRITDGECVVVQDHNGAAFRGVTKSPKRATAKRAAPAKTAPIKTAPVKASVSVNGNGKVTKRPAKATAPVAKRKLVKA